MGQNNKTTKKVQSNAQEQVDMGATDSGMDWLSDVKLCRDVNDGFPEVDKLRLKIDLPQIVAHLLAGTILAVAQAGPSKSGGRRCQPNLAHGSWCFQQPIDSLWL